MNLNKEGAGDETKRSDEMKGGQKLFSSFIQLVKASSVPMSSHTHTHTPSVTACCLVDNRS